MRLFIKVTLVGALLFDLGAGSLTAPRSGDHKLDRYLERLTDTAGSADRVRVIVTLARGQEERGRRGLHRKGHPVLSQHRSIGAVTALVPVQDLEALSQDMAVDRFLTCMSDGRPRRPFGRKTH